MNSKVDTSQDLPVSKMAEQLVGSEIIKLAGEVKSLIAQGQKIHNFTIGDFDSNIFPIPSVLKKEIIQAYQNNLTNYPASNGMAELREAVSKFIEDKQGLSYTPDEFLIAGGARPLIYACYRALIDPDDKIIFPVPSWNNNHYTHLSNAQKVIIQTTPENNFMPSAEDIKDHIKDAAMVALCSPLNPTGTVFSKVQLAGICELVLAENKRRGAGAKPVYLMYDQIYWQLCYGDTQHFDPVSLYPEMKDYTIYIDGISKAFAATGVRVGWAFGPTKVINKMKSILGHVGAWSPKAEQLATASFLNQAEAVNEYIDDIKIKLNSRLTKLYEGLKSMKSKGFPVDVIPPQAAIYLTIKIDLEGLTKPNGEKITQTEEITDYILKEAGIAIVPFYAFGTERNSKWYRLSVGTSVVDEIPNVLGNLQSALERLK